MNISTDLLESINLLSQTVTEELIALSDISISPEPKSVLITMNKLNRNLKKIDTSRLNPVTSGEVFKLIIKYCEIFLKDITENQLASYEQVGIECAIILQSKLEHFLESFDYMIYYDKNDIFSLPVDHERWTKLRNVVHIHKYDNSEEVERDNDFVMKHLVLAQATIFNSYQESAILSKISFGASSLYYSFFERSAVRTVELFHARPKLGPLKRFFNFPETDFIGIPLAFLIPSIPVHEQFFIPRTVSHVSESFRSKNVDSAIQYTQADNISVRFLSNDHRFYNALIIHIHGGGFISMSSRSHQCYTRKWVQSLNIPCLSIDYRLSPEFPFPAALDDVWQVYNWVLKFAESQLNVRPDRIFLAGDSGGANIALSLTYRIIEENLKAPSGVMLAYPALNISEKQFSSSIINSIDDKFISLSFLKMCLRSYIPTEFSQDYYLISPINAPRILLERLPPIRIATGDKDPFHDDCWRFTERILEAGGDVKYTVFEGMIHGAISFCFKGGMRGSQAMVDRFANWMEDLLYRTN